jgi:hypothetical protein
MIFSDVLKRKWNIKACEPVLKINFVFLCSIPEQWNHEQLIFLHMLCDVMQEIGFDLIIVL